MTETTLHCAFEFHRVLRCHYGSFIRCIIVTGLLRELSDAAHEPIHTVGARDDKIRFVDGGKVSLNLITDCGCSILFVAMAFASSRWTCFFVIDRRLQGRIDDEGCSFAIPEVAEGGFRPLPRLGHHEDLP